MTENKYTVVNPLEVPVGRYDKEKLWLFHFGAYADVRAAVWHRCLDDALEEAAEWLAETHPGLLTEPDYADARRELGPEASEDALQEAAEADLTYTESGWLVGYEWWVDAADPADESYKIVFRASAEAWLADYWPKVLDVAGALQEEAATLDADVHTEGCDGTDCDGCTDVRLQVDRTGGWDVHTGDPCYDQSHGGYWGSDILSARSDFESMAEDLIGQAAEAWWQERHCAT